jgi:hypothetical protein
MLFHSADIMTMNRIIRMKVETETLTALIAAKARMMVNDIMITTVTTPTVCGASHVSFSLYTQTLLDHPDADSDADGYAGQYAPSAESFGPSRMGYTESSAPTLADYAGPPGAQEAYPAWTVERQIPLSKEEIEDIFLDLTQKFGFQRDSMRNMVCFIYAMSSFGTNPNDLFVVRFFDATT